MSACAFECSLPDGVGEPVGIGEPLESWSCRHEATHGDYCIYHAPPAEKDDDAVVTALVEAVENHSQADRVGAEKQFVGAQFGDLDLSFVAPDSADNHPLDLRVAHVAGDLDCSHAAFTEPIDMRGIEIEGDVAFEDAYVGNDIWIEDGYVGGDANVFDAGFHDDAHFAGLTVEGEICLEDVTLHESLDLRNASFGGDVVGDALSCDDEVEMEGATFAGPVSFADATFEDDVELEEAVVEDRVDFCGTTFEGDLIIVDLEGEGRLVDFTDAALAGGRFAWTVGDRMFDLTNATVGQVTLEPAGGRAFEGLHVEGTRFEGFDFGRYIDELAATDWAIHASDEDRAGTSEAETPGTIENTYVKAKNGAKASGNDRVAAEFFLQEMRFRARGHQSRVVDGSLSVPRRVAALGAYLSNRLLGLSTGYGERPSRVVAIAFAVVFGFAGLFALTMSFEPFGTPFGYLVISATSFVTLVLVGSANITDPGVHMLAEIEGFTGAFLIALFVFTLTRSINR